MVCVSGWTEIETTEGVQCASLSSHRMRLVRVWTSECGSLLSLEDPDSTDPSKTLLPPAYTANRKASDCSSEYQPMDTAS
mmetsp:Transcript_19179/g.19315  ORF Transcript_19179/g.19315 Transcript_19179/m.19315 type:complete len:80 (+) Transcript_19179:553-792(+)